MRRRARGMVASGSSRWLTKMAEGRRLQLHGTTVCISKLSIYRYKRQWSLSSVKEKNAAARFEPGPTTVDAVILFLVSTQSRFFVT